MWALNYLLFCDICIKDCKRYLKCQYLLITSCQQIFYSFNLIQHLLTSASSSFVLIFPKLLWSFTCSAYKLLTWKVMKVLVRWFLKINLFNHLVQHACLQSSLVWFWICKCLENTRFCTTKYTVCVCVAWYKISLRNRKLSSSLMYPALAKGVAIPPTHCGLYTILFLC